MRIRFTLDIHRTPRPAPVEEDETPNIYDLSGAQVEHAGWQRMGFTVPARFDYEEDE